MSVFEQIDKELGKKEQKELYSLYALVVLVIGFLFYYFVFPAAQDFYNKEFKDNKSLKQEVSNKKNEIISSRKTLIAARNKIKEIKAHIAKLNKENELLQKEIQKLSFAKFDSNEWAKLLKNSVVEAIKEGIEMKLISSNIENVKGYLKCFSNNINKKGLEKTSTKENSNVYTSCNMKPQKFKFINKKLTFTLAINSSYKNLLAYMYKYENSKELFRVNSLSITPNKYILKISLYGYEK